MNDFWGLMFVEKMNREQCQYDDVPETQHAATKKPYARLRLVLTAILNIFNR